MKSKQLLSIEQMQHLQELGLELDYDTLYSYIKFEDTDWLLKPSLDLSVIGISCKYIPAYTLQDVLDALPAEIIKDKKRCWLSIDLADKTIEYYNEYAMYMRRSVYFEFYKSSSLIDAAYELLCWVLTNKYIQ